MSRPVWKRLLSYASQPALSSLAIGRLKRSPSLILKAAHGQTRRSGKRSSIETRETEYSLCKLRHHIVVEAVEHDEERAHARREAQYSLRAEGVRLEQAILAGPDRRLLITVPSIERREVKVGRGEVDVVIFR